MNMVQQSIAIGFKAGKSFFLQTQVVSSGPHYSTKALFILYLLTVIYSTLGK